MSPFRITMLLFIVVVLTTTQSNGQLFTQKLKDICRFGSFCHYFVDGIKQTIYGLYNFNKDEQEYCLKERIEECTCYEMLILEKSWIPNWPRLDEVDVKRVYLQTSKVYHPDHLDTDYEGDRNKPFIFLEKCASWFKYPELRKDYRGRLEAPLKALVGLGTEDVMESIARNIIYNVNIQFKINNPDPQPQPSNTTQNNDGTDKTVERLHIFLDNSQTMKGASLEKGKRRLKRLQHRIFATPTNIHLIDANSRKIVDEKTVLNISNINESVYNVWDGNKGSGGGYQYYLWEYIWFEMQNKKNTDCEIIILTDGYNTYRTGGSHSGFQGIEGITKLMNELKINGDALCRTFVYCVSNDCKKEVGKSFLDLAIPTGGFSCDVSNFGDCDGILSSSHAERVGFAKDLKNEHMRQVEDGKVLALPWFDYETSKYLSSAQ